MAQASVPGPAPAPPQTAGVTLACRPDRAGNRLLFPYTVTNGSGGDIYVMDAVPVVDPATRQATADPHSAVVWLAGDGFAHILRGIAPLPSDRDVLGRVIPLAAKLAPGESLERSLEVPLPLAETGPYNPDLPLREYQLAEIQGVVLTVEYLAAAAEGFGAEPVDYAPGLYRVWSRNTVGQTEQVSCRFPSRQLTILKRSDDFPRPE